MELESIRPNEIENLSAIFRDIQTQDLDNDEYFGAVLCGDRDAFHFWQEEDGDDDNNNSGGGGGDNGGGGNGGGSSNATCPENPDPCDKFEKELKRYKYGKFIWNQLAYVFQGNIIYTPQNSFTLSVMQKVS